MQIATWNVNSIRQRLEIVSTWLKERQPEVVCLQELKCETAVFPRQVFEDLGYNVAVHGQKGFNGVAILSKLPLDEVTEGLDGDSEDVQARFIEAVVSTPGGVMRVVSLYLPNGNPIDTEKFVYKLAWMQRLEDFARSRLLMEEAFVLAGDFNVIPEPEDVRDPAAWVNDALFQPKTRRAFRTLLNLGLTDALRASTDAAEQYTFWDYQAGAWQKNNGIRIDHLLLSPQAADRLRGVEIDRTPRGWEKPSDHTPVIAEFA